MTNKLYKLSIITLLIFVSGTIVVSAQETEATTTDEMATTTEEVTDDDATTTEDISDNGATTTNEMATTTDEEMSDEVALPVEDTDIPTDEESMYTDEEIAEVIETTEPLDEDTIESIEDIEGTIIAISDEVVVIETLDGELITVDKETYEKKSPRGGTVVGYMLQSAKVKNTKTNPTIQTSRGTFSVSPSIPVTRNGVALSFEDLNDDDEVVAVFNADGNLVALEVISEINKASQTTLYTTIAAILIILILAGLVSYRKRRKQLRFR